MNYKREVSFLQFHILCWQRYTFFTKVATYRMNFSFLFCFFLRLKLLMLDCSTSEVGGRCGTATYRTIIHLHLRDNYPFTLAGQLSICTYGTIIHLHLRDNYPLTLTGYVSVYTLSAPQWGHRPFFLICRPQLPQMNLLRV